MDALLDHRPVAHLRTLEDLDSERLMRLLRRAAELKADRAAWGSALRGRTVLLQFDKPSTRRACRSRRRWPASAAWRPFVDGAGSPLGVREPIRDVARVVSRYCAAIVLRTGAQDTVDEFAAWSSAPVVNGLTERHHPVQALADLQTLTERFGGATGLDLAFVGDGGSNIAHSLIQGLRALGGLAQDRLPPGSRAGPGHPGRRPVGRCRRGRADRRPRGPVGGRAGRAGRLHGRVRLDGRGEPREAKLAALAPYRVTQKLFDTASSVAVFLHCLPAHRGEEVDDEVIEGPRSAVWDQAENRLHTAAALLVTLLDLDVDGGEADGLSSTSPVRRRLSARRPAVLGHGARRGRRRRRGAVRRQAARPPPRTAVPESPRGRP
jgi:ornithine carbamoyltransferase